MPSIDFPAIDADNHYYEPDDCCTRHIESKYRDRAVRVVENSDGVREWRFGDKPLSFHRYPRSQVMEPGMYRAFMAGETFDPEAPPKFIPADSPAFSNRDARIKVLDHFGLEAVMMVPSFGLAFEADCREDPEAAAANVRAFNRWVEDDWGYAYQGRLISPATISLFDLETAVEELERVLKEGARVVMLRAGPLFGRSPADSYFDPFWSRVEEANIPVLLHIGVSGYNPVVGAMWGENPDVNETEMSPFLYYTCFGKRPIMDTVACFILHNLFGRYPGLRMMSVENGSAWIPGLLADMDGSARVSFSTQGAKSVPLIGGPLTDSPSNLFKKHFYVCPFFEESVSDLVGWIGAEHVLFGSDWPHPEGVREPLDFLDDCGGLSEDQLQLVMRDNSARLLGVAP
ncbi:amidohydrolase [Myxococcota bacterium]|nr:amidohydrolase [Myxococcota bacterium]